MHLANIQRNSLSQNAMISISVPFRISWIFTLSREDSQTRSASSTIEAPKSLTPHRLSVSGVVGELCFGYLSSPTSRKLFSLCFISWDVPDCGFSVNINYAGAHHPRHTLRVCKHLNFFCFVLSDAGYSSASPDRLDFSLSSVFCSLFFIIRCGRIPTCVSIFL